MTTSQTETPTSEQTETQTSDQQPAARISNRPRFADFLLLPATSWRVPEIYGTEATATFINNVRAEIGAPQTRVLVADEFADLLRGFSDENWDVTRDIPCTKPIENVTFWEWRGKGTREPAFVGVLCKGVAKRTLSEAIAQFEGLQKITFDYDVAMILQSAKQALHQTQSDDLRAPALFLNGSVFVAERGEAVAPLWEVRPLGGFALTMRANGRPVPDSLALLTWDADEAQFSPERVERELRAAVARVLLMHCLFRAPETRSEAVVGGRDTRKSFRDTQLLPHVHLRAPGLNNYLRKEAFADKYGLKEALSMLQWKFKAAPLIWPK